MENIRVQDNTPIVGEFEKKDGIVVFKGASTAPPEKSNIPQIGIILYPIRFKDGIIQVRFRFMEASLGSTIGIIFDYLSLDISQGFPCQYAGISNLDGYIYTNTRQPNESIHFSYRKQNLIKPNEEYVLAIDLRGYFLRVYFNNVLVGNCIANKLAETNIGLYFHNTGCVEVLKLEVEKKNPKAFVVMQFGDEYNPIYDDVIKKVCEDRGLDVIRGDESFDTGMIISDIVRQIEESSVIIADITPDNPNVFYEVGYAHALKKPTILMSDKVREKLPFDVSGFRTIFYDNKIGGKKAVEKMLGDFLDNMVLGK